MKILLKYYQMMLSPYYQNVFTESEILFLCYRVKECSIGLFNAIKKIKFHGGGFDFRFYDYSRGMRFSSQTHACSSNKMERHVSKEFSQKGGNRNRMIVALHASRVRRGCVGYCCRIIRFATRSLNSITCQERNR